MLAAAVAYGGYWFVASRAVLQGARAALVQMQADGRADFTDVSLAGFPSRFDLTIDNPALVGSSGRVRWQAPFVQIFALSYHPNQIIAVWPHDQTLTLAGAGSVAITAQDLRASALFSATPALPLDHAQIVGKGLRLVSDLDWGLAMEDLRAAIRSSDSAANSYRIGLDMTAVAPSGRLLAASLPLTGAPEATGSLHADLTAALDAPLDRRLAQAAARLTHLEVTALHLGLGRFDLTGTGSIEVDATGTPDGRIMLTVLGWQGLPDLLADAGLIKPEVVPTLRNVLTAMAGGKPDGTLLLPLVFQGGMMGLGPLPLGRAPRF